MFQTGTNKEGKSDLWELSKTFSNGTDSLDLSMTLEFAIHIKFVHHLREYKPPYQFTKRLIALKYVILSSLLQQGLIAQYDHA